MLVLGYVLFQVGVLQTSGGDGFRIEGARQWTRCQDVTGPSTRHDLRSQRRRVGDVGGRVQVSINPKLDRRSGGHGDAR